MYGNISIHCRGWGSYSWSISYGLFYLNNTQANDFANNLILAALTLVLTILVVMLFLVLRTLIKIAKASGVEITPEPKEKRTPIWKAFVQNQFLVFCHKI